MNAEYLWRHLQSAQMNNYFWQRSGKCGDSETFYKFLENLQAMKIYAVQTNNSTSSVW